MRASAIAAIVFMLTTLSAAAQAPPVSASGSRVTLRGVVVDASDGSPLRRARITLSGRPANAGNVVTDEDGRFSASVVPATMLTLRIVKAGYASMLVRVSPDRIRALDPLRLEVPRGAVITGRAIDDAGQAAQMVRIQRLTSDGLIWSAVGPDGLPFGDGSATVSPDDRGEYRVGGLVAGRYSVQAFPAFASISITAGPAGEAFTVKIDGTSFRPASVTVDLQPGAEAAGVDLIVDRLPAGPAPADRAAESAGGTIRGTVSTTDGSPLAEATVTATRPVGVTVGGPRTTTDASGRFTLRGVPLGSVNVQASKRGYVPLQAGQRGGGLPGLPVRVEAGKEIDNLSIVLPRSGAISGMVIDEHGEPVQEASVRLLQVRRQPTGALAREQGTFLRQTDDRGQFRFLGVRPGDYVLMALLAAEPVDPAAAPGTAYVPAYYPDTPDFANAAPIRMVDGDEIPGVVLTMRRMPVGRVTGIVHNSQGLPFTGTVRLMLRHAPANVPGGVRVVNPPPGGEFVFADVPPGDYVLSAQVASGPAGPEFAAGQVTVVDGDPAAVTMRTSPGSRVSGRIVLEGGSGDLLWGYSATSVPIDVVSSPGSVSNTGPISTGEPFTLSALAGPTRLRVWSDDRNWYLKSILINGFDVVDTPFDFGFDGRAYSDVEVVFSRRGASIAGRATDGRGAPMRDYAVHVFSTDRDRWFGDSRWVKLARASADGGFTASSLPPGEYWVVAVDRVDASSAPDWVDTELLTMLSSRATRVTLGEGQSHSLTLRLINR